MTNLGLDIHEIYHKNSITQGRRILNHEQSHFGMSISRVPLAQAIQLCLWDYIS
jgi:hypothetical protein